VDSYLNQEARYGAKGRSHCIYSTHHTRKKATTHPALALRVEEAAEVNSDVVPELPPGEGTDSERSSKSLHNFVRYHTPPDLL